jgi:hypothetical protein
MYGHHRRGSSVQSLQTIFSITKPSASTFSSALHRVTHKTPSTSAIPSSIYKSPTTYTSLCHINSVSSQPRSSLLKHLSHDDPLKKSIDDFTNSSPLTNIPSLLPLEVNTSDKHQPIEVRVRCIFLRVGEIDTLNERYTSEIFFEASWYASDPKVESKYDPQMGHFNPQLVVLNNIGDSLRHDVSRSNSERTIAIHTSIDIIELNQCLEILLLSTLSMSRTDQVDLRH